MRSPTTRKCAKFTSEVRTADPLLTLTNVTAGYGEAIVIDDVSLEINEAEGLALLGRNGVGKSTLIQTIMGLTQMKSGTIHWSGKDITNLKAYERAQIGLGWVPQERDVFQSLSVDENLTVVARSGLWNKAKIFDLFPRLQERAENMGNQLSGGEQQMLAIARTLMTNPSILLLDEPLEGLAPIVVEELSAAISAMRSDGGMALVLVEQHADVALGLTDNAIILERGRTVFQGNSADLSADKDALERFIGLQVGQ
ncbi:MAG: ABC transporter ATP-binding protein [Paracoccaceae bacterium]